MTTIVTRAGKGSPLTNNEMDTNLTNLNTDKLEVTTAAATYAPIASPTFTGDPRAPTPVAADNDTSVATTAYVTNAANAKVSKAGDTMTGQLAIDMPTSYLAMIASGVAQGYVAGLAGNGLTLLNDQGAVAARVPLGTTNLSVTGTSYASNLVAQNGTVFGASKSFEYVIDPQPGESTDSLQYRTGLYYEPLSTWAGAYIDFHRGASSGDGWMQFYGTKFYMNGPLTGTNLTLTNNLAVNGSSTFTGATSTTGTSTFNGRIIVNNSLENYTTQYNAYGVDGGGYHSFVNRAASGGWYFFTNAGSVIPVVIAGNAISNALQVTSTGITSPKVTARNSGATNYINAQLEIGNAGSGACVIAFHREGASACVLSHNGSGLIVGDQADGSGAQIPLRVTGAITTNSSLAGTSMQVACGDNGTLAATTFLMPVAGEVDTSVNFALNRGSARWFAPGEDSNYLCGWSLARWSTIYVTNAPIVGSDERLKTPLRPFTDAELAVAKDLAKSISVYQWLAKVEVEGDAARQHIGLSAQFVESTFAAHGLDARKYSMFCYDSIESAGFKDRSELPENIRETAPDDRYSLRYEQLAMFIARGQEQRLAAIEAKLGV